MDINQILQWIQGQLHQYERRISTLENSLHCAEDEISKLKAKPPIHVGTIQYKFDQLKVETLEGTLSIGLNPQDMQGIEDIAIGNGAPGTPLQPMEMMQRGITIEEAINEFIESDLPTIVASAQDRLGVPQADSYLSFIKNDIKKQLPGRIESHLRIPGTGEQPENLVETTIAALKKEIENGVLTFLSTLPGGMKGGSQ
jgi:spore germination protein PC